MSRVLYAAPVTSNVIAEMPTNAVWRRKVQYCLELFDSELYVQQRLAVCSLWQN